jgi:hypothetical protein
MKTTSPTFFLVASLACAANLRAQTSYPMIMSLHPTAAQVGQSSEHEIQSRYSMHDADRVIVTGEGVTGEVVTPKTEVKPGAKPPNLVKIKVRFTVAADAKPGVRDFRIATPRGVSTLGQLVIVREPVVVENPKGNDAAEGAQSVEVPATICGTIEKGEDVDFYRFHAKAGTGLTFHVRSMRLQNRIHDLQQHVDPILTLRHASGTTLAASDNYFYGDPCLDYTFEREGDYLLEIRDVRYQGNRYWEYSIEVSDKPLVTNVYPLGVAAGADTPFELVGFQLPEQGTVQATIPNDIPAGPQTLEFPLGSEKTNPVPVVGTTLPLIQEAAGENNAFASAQAVSHPAGINGRIEAESDIDCYKFTAKKGEKLTIEVFARRCGSGLDPYLRIVNAQGRQMTVSDDMRIGIRNYADSIIENWTVPADGDYAIELRDLHLRGGARFVYFMTVTRAEPHFELYVDTDKSQLTPGTSAALFVRAYRKNGFDGGIDLAIEGLPEGVTASCGRILPGKGQDGCIVLTAADGAPANVSNVTITGTGEVPGADGKPRQLQARAAVYQETYQPGGGRGHWPVTIHTVSVSAPQDILSVKLSTTEIVLEPGASQKIGVTIERAPGFDKNVSLDVMVRHLSRVYGSSLPEGVTIDAKNSKTLLTKGQSEGHITLTAAKNAPAVEKQQIAVMANIAINFVMKATYAGPPVFVTVKPAAK